jgi:hypothetical protein
LTRSGSTLHSYFRRGSNTSPIRSDGRGRDPAIFARAYVEEAVVEERYSYQQRVSRNPSMSVRSGHTGRIEVRMPYDGERYFTRNAAEDVDRRLDEGNDTDDREARIGHLVFTDHQHTNLSEVLMLDGNFGATPLRVPVRSPVLCDQDALVADCDEHRSEIDYVPSPDRPKVLPIALDIQLTDPDHHDLMTSTARLRRMRRERAILHLEPIAEKIKRFVGFKPYLRLQMRVLVTLPPLKGDDREPPIIRRVGVKIPTVTSLAESSLNLRVDYHPTTVQHNPENRHLEWFDVEMAAPREELDQPERADGDPEDTDDDRPRRFESPEMVVLFLQPGELFAQRALEAEVEVEVPDELLSGTQARLFDACGNAYGPGPLKVRSILTSRCTVVLHDAFADRLVSPYQSFHFDELIPDTLRIEDIRAALEDQRFSIVNVWPVGEKAAKPGKAAEPRRLRRFVVAERVEGPDTLELWVLVEGRRRATQREARQPGGHRYTSKFDSGDMRIFIRGQVRGNARNLVHEINELQVALRERFRRLKAHR